MTYDGVSGRDNFQYSKVKLVEDSDRNDPLNARAVLSLLFIGQIAQITLPRLPRFHGLLGLISFGLNQIYLLPSGLPY